MTEKENESPVTVLTNCAAKQQLLTDLDSKTGLFRRLSRGLTTRIKFVESHLAKTIAFQVQAMRAKKGWTQEQLAKRLGSNQNAVYRLENPYYGKQTLTTLRKVAAEFDVGLVVRFVPFSQLVDWISGIPHVDSGLTPSALEVPDFETEVKSGTFQEQVHPEGRDDVINTATIDAAARIARENIGDAVLRGISNLTTPTGPVKNAVQFTAAEASPSLKDHLPSRIDIPKVELPAEIGSPPLGDRSDSEMNVPIPENPTLSFNQAA